MSIKDNLLNAFKGMEFTLKQAYQLNPDMPKESVRARIYENLGKSFEKINKGIYITKEQDCLLIEGNGRSLESINNESIDCIITDFPWEDKKSNKGGNRNFATYKSFEYTAKDFVEKARVLKSGSFLCEMLPAENESNWEMLYKIKQFAKDAGLQYYAKVIWKKGDFVANTGRKAKNSEEIMIFSKGKARSLRLDAKKTNNVGYDCFMSGTNKMLPTVFDIPRTSKNEMICQAEKPVALFEQLLEYLTLENELVLDQFAGSGAVGVACKNKNRLCILVEEWKEQIEKTANRLQAKSCALC